jgi:hypothetical protein
MARNVGKPRISGNNAALAVINSMLKSEALRGTCETCSNIVA